MNIQVLKSTYKNILDNIALIGKLDAEKAFDTLLSYVANKVGVQNALFKGHIDVYNYLSSNLDIDSLKNTNLDFIGELYNELGIAPKDFVFTDNEVADDAANWIIKDNDIKSIGFPKSLMIEDISTGALLLNIYSKVNGNVAIYGTSKDKVSYKIAITNLGLNGLLTSTRVLYLKEGDNVPKDAGDESWVYANTWI
jgi:hypothetical protein